MKVLCLCPKKRIDHVAALKSEIFKKKQMGEKMKEDKQNRIEETAVSRFLVRSKREERKAERVKLLEELKAVNIENAQYFDTSNITHPILYKTRDGLVDHVKHEGNGKKLFETLKTIIMNPNAGDQNVSYEQYGDFKGAWFEPAMDGDPLKSKYKVLYCTEVGPEQDFLCITVMADEGIVEDGWSVTGLYDWRDIFDDILTKNENLVSIYKS